MAVNPKSQLLKLGIGTMSVVAIVGATGWVWEATSGAGPQPSEAASWPSWEMGDHDDDDEDWDDDDDDDDEHGRSFRLVRPGSATAPSGRVRTRRS